jgi:hypothetical protein
MKSRRQRPWNSRRFPFRLQAHSDTGWPIVTHRKGTDMRRTLTGTLIASVLLSSLIALGEEPLPPPPPPPPPAESENTGSSGGDSAFRKADALLDASSKNRKMMLSFFAGIPYGAGYAYYGYGYGYGFPLGLSARFYLPIVNNGFIPPVNDSFGLEFGLDTNFYINYGTGIGIPVEARWNFHLIPKLEVYGKAGFGLGFFTSGLGTAFYGYAIAHAGVLYQITDTIALRAEVGYPSIKIGIGIAL